MSQIEHDQLVEKVNAEIGRLERQRPTANVLGRKQRLAILIRRYVGGERTELLFQNMRTETVE